jgi:hypothetical protein
LGSRRMRLLRPLIWQNRDQPTICTVPLRVRKAGMVLRKAFNWLIAITVAAGLLAAPLAVPAMGAPQPTAAAGEMQAMAGDMPCCPDQQDQKTKDCGSCPFVALCMVTIASAAPDSVGTLMDRAFSRSAFALPNDLLVDGLGEYPPDHPPRIIV